MNYLTKATLLILIPVIILGIIFYFKNVKDTVDTVDTVDIEIDPFGDIEVDEKPSPANNVPIISDEPDINSAPEVTIVPNNPRSPLVEDEAAPVQPTPTSTPAQPLIPPRGTVTALPGATVLEPPEAAPVQPTPTSTPAQPLIPPRGTVTALPVATVLEPPEDAPVQPTPTSTPAQPLIPVITKRTLSGPEVIMIMERFAERQVALHHASVCYAEGIKTGLRGPISKLKFTEDKIMNMLETGNLRDNLTREQEDAIDQLAGGNAAAERVRRACGEVTHKRILSLDPPTGEVPVQATPTSTPAQPLIPVITKRTLRVAERERVLRGVKEELEAAGLGECYAEGVKDALHGPLSKLKFTEDKIMNILETGNLRDNLTMEQFDVITQSNGGPVGGNALRAACDEKSARMGYPTGTKWNLKGTTGNDRQKCNNNCKGLGYNYFIHNPPPGGDGGCGCYKAAGAPPLSQLNMTGHSNAATRRVV